jgi:hypothetical protein
MLGFIKNARMAMGDLGLRETRLWRALRAVRKERQLFRELRRIEPRSSGRGILVINHFFDGEIEAIQDVLAAFPDVKALLIPPEPFFSPAMSKFPPELQAARVPYTTPELEHLRLEYRSYCRWLRDELQKVFPFESVLTPSDSFFWLREFIGACQEQSIPTVVADKEGTLSPYSWEVEPDRVAYLFPPIADYFLVWSARQKRFWQRAGVELSRIDVVGSARTDRFVKLRHSPAPGAVLVFDFDEDAYINNFAPSELPPGVQRSWRELRRALHQVMLRVARDFPQVRFILKCHPQQVTSKFYFDGRRPRNLRVRTGAPRRLPELMEDAALVVGFQTTGLLEAAVARIPVLYAAWGPLYDALKSRILPWHEAGFGMHWCRSEQELEDRMRSVLAGRMNGLSSLDRSRIEEYFHCADGHSAHRLIESVLQVGARSEQ